MSIITTDDYKREKLHDSIVSACLSERAPEGQASQFATEVCKGVENWLDIRPEVTSDDLRRVAANILGIYHPDAAYVYEQQAVTL